MILLKRLTIPAMALLCYITEAGASLSQQDINTRISECRVKLKDIERLRNQAIAMGSLDAFEDLTARAKDILSTIETGTENPELHLLLGECQGILNSLLLTLKPTLNRTKTTRSAGTAPTITPGRPSKIQTVARANSYLNEPVRQESTEDEQKEELLAAQSLLQSHSVSIKQSKQSHSNKESRDDLPLQ